MSIKCIALDLDRTTLNGQSRLSDRNRQALEAAMKKGIHIVVASGRAYDTLPKDVMSVPGIEYAVTSNGAAVYHVPTGKCLKEYHIPEDVPEKILELTGKYENLTYECFIHGVAFGPQQYVDEPERFLATEGTIEYMIATRTLVPDIKSFILEHKNELNSLDVLVRDDVEKDKIMKLLKANLPDVYMTSSFSQLVEIAHKDCGKKTGLVYVVERLGLGRDEVAAFGDADNDIDMLAYAGVGIAMANASDGCKAVADHHTLHHDEDGVAWGMEHILGII